MFDEEIPFGQVADLDVNVVDVVRLRLVVEEIETGFTGSNCTIDRGPATWADPALHL